MPTEKTTDAIEITREVINVTTDVYDPLTANEHYYEELRHGLYRPMIHVREVKIKGQKRTAFTICRFPLGAADEAFVITQKRQATDKTYPFVSEVNTNNLFVLGIGEMVRA